MWAARSRGRTDPLAVSGSGYRDPMTSDLDTTTDDLFNTIRALWLEAQGATGDDLPTGGFGQRAGASVRDSEIAEATQLELPAVQEYLDNANGVKLVVDRDGDTRLVKGL